MVEEVRRHFGFKIDPRDERFKELLEQKEKEERKKAKEAKKKVRQEYVMAKLEEQMKKAEDRIEASNVPEKSWVPQICMVSFVSRYEICTCGTHSLRESFYFNLLWMKFSIHYNSPAFLESIRTETEL